MFCNVDFLGGDSWLGACPIEVAVGMLMDVAGEEMLIREKEPFRVDSAGLSFISSISRHDSSRSITILELLFLP